MATTMRSSAAAKTATGHIVLVQEQRFRLTTDLGQSLLLRLAHDANIDEETLCQLHADEARVVVEYSGEPGLESGVAHVVRTTSC